VATAAQIAAARLYAPPLFVVEPFDRRGAQLRQVSPKAVEYARRAGLAVLDVYPNALGPIREMAPMAGSMEAARFVRAVGLRAEDVYPFAGEPGPAPSPSMRWAAWAVAGVFLGAVTVGGAVGWLIGGSLGAIAGAGQR
jgi:hypothetical protein